MQVNLVSITKPLLVKQNIYYADDSIGENHWYNDTSCLSPEEYITYVARVSNPNNQRNFDTSNKLLNYCIKHHHWSIFEQVDMTVEIVTSRAIAAQLLRHRSAVFQEYSQRYAEVQTIEDIELRLQDTKNRQNSLDKVATLIDGFMYLDPVDEDLKTILDTIGQSLMTLRLSYNKLIEYGIAKECARMILPLATTTKLYMKNNLRNWIHYIEVRALGEGVQKEHREIALAIQDIFKQQFPVISKALNW